MVFRSGVDDDGKSRIETTVCPRRLLDEDANDPEGFVEWWFEATHWDGMSGAPGLPEWPHPGGLLGQPALLAEAVSLLRTEWPYAHAKPKSGKPRRET